MPLCPHKIKVNPAGLIPGCCPCCGWTHDPGQPDPCSNAFSVPADWTFRSAGVAAGFDRHVREQLPWYDLATGALAHLVRSYLPRWGNLYDVGASTGNVGRACAQILRDREGGLFAFEPSAEMRTEYERLVPSEISGVSQESAEEIVYPTAESTRPDVIVFFLSLSFVDPRHREQVLRRALLAIRTGGALIVLDKADPAPGYFGTVLRRLTLAGKVATGTPAEEIIAKELSLSGVQRPLDPDLLGTIALTYSLHVCEWFRFGEFVGWIVEVDREVSGDR